MDVLAKYLGDEDRLVKIPTLILGIIVIGGAIISAEALVKGVVTNRWIRAGVYLLILIGWVSFWLYKRNVYPRKSKDKIGVVISISTENDKSKTRLRNDFYNRLQEQLFAGSLDDSVEIILLKNYQAERLNPIILEHSKMLGRSRAQGTAYTDSQAKAWAKMQNKIRGHVYVFGEILEREGGKYFLNTNGFVAHRPVSKEVQKEFDRDFMTIWISQISFLEKAEYSGFRFSADYIWVSVKYIVGIAAFVSQDLFMALRFHDSLIQEMSVLPPLPNLAVVRERLRQLLSEEHLIASRLYHLEQNQEEAKKHLDRCFELDGNNYPGLIFQSILDFTEKNDPKKSLQTLSLAKKFARHDGTWRYNEAFILMHLGKYEKSLRVYEKIANYTYENERTTINDVIEFNEKLLEQKPEFIESLFILGFLRFKKYDNLVIAQENLEEFLRKASNEPKFRILFNEAETCLAEIRKEFEQISRPA